jgi:Protein of unknown function (DUF2442)
VILQLVVSGTLVALIIGTIVYILGRMMRQTRWKLDQSSLAFFDARRPLEAEYDGDSFVLTRARVEPLIEVTDARWDRAMLWFHLVDGRVIGAPLARWPKLQHASRRQRGDWRRQGEHSLIVWDSLDVRISVRVLMGHDP